MALALTQLHFPSGSVNKLPPSGKENIANVVNPISGIPKKVFWP